MNTPLLFDSWFENVFDELCSEESKIVLISFASTWRGTGDDDLLKETINHDTSKNNSNKEKVLFV